MTIAFRPDTAAWRSTVAVRISPAEAPGWVRARMAGRTGTRWVGVDGLGAAGKTTLAHQIAAALPEAVVVAVDDFTRPGVATWDHALFVSRLVTPLTAGSAAHYQTWDLVGDQPRDWVEVRPGQPVIVEGVSATDQRVPVAWDLTLWLEVPAEVRWARIVARDPPVLLDRWRDDWLPEEQAYFRTQRPPERVDAVVTAG